MQECHEENSQTFKTALETQPSLSRAQTLVLLDKLYKTLRLPSVNYHPLLQDMYMSCGGYIWVHISEVYLEMPPVV